MTRSLLLETALFGTDPGSTRGRFQKPPDLWHIVGGEHIHTECTPIFDPLSGNVSWQMPTATPAVVEQAIASVAQFPCGTDNVWDIETRGKVFGRVAQLIEERWPKLRAAITLCFPKSDPEADNELRLMQRFAASLSANRIRTLVGFCDGGPAIGYEGTTHTDFLPWGPTSGVWPCNYPGEISGLQVMASLACGNAIVTKPHEYCGPVEIALHELFVEAGMPPHLWAIVHGYGPDTSALVLDSRIQQSVFTGSSRVAHLLAAQRPDSVRAEQSGLNWIWFEEPWHGVDVVKATAGVASSAFGLGGQRCSCCRFVFAPATWGKTEFLEALRVHSQQYKWADRSLPALMTWSTDAFRDSLAMLETIGAKRVFGGDPVLEHSWQKPAGSPNDRFNFGAVHPSVFTLEPSELRLTDDPVRRVLMTERFGPALTVVFWHDDAERDACARFINSLPERLTCGIGTNSHAATLAKLRRKLRLNGVTNVGEAPWTTGAEEFKMFGPVAGNAASIGGSDRHIQRVWLAPIGVNYRF